MMQKTQTNFLKIAGLILTACLLTACDKGDANKDAEHDQAVRDANARATGSACRQSARALEDCYKMNPDSDRGSIFAGWKDMNDYMRENKMDDVKPAVDTSAAASSAASTDNKSSSKK
jgi:hypothetical protein